MPKNNNSAVIESDMKILVLTSIYPGGVTPKGFTPVVHYFVKEWIEFGYDVRVINAASYFPSIYYKAPKWLRRIVQDKIGIVLPDVQRKNDMEYELEGVKVLRIAMRKWVPMSGYSEKELKKACDKSLHYIQKQDFLPDVIISHWVNPQLALLSFLKEKTGAFTTLVLHESGKGIKEEFKNWEKIFNDVDVWGYRSNAIKEKFESIYGTPLYSFRCFSGIPASFCDHAPIKDGSFHNRFVQVGILMDRKFPHKAIEGVAEACRGEAFSFELVGDGGMMDSLRLQVEASGLQGQVSLCGRVARDEVVEKLDKADVFILISQNEVFGLVYLEAMARGCIVIASRGEGMDGIINDGINGFFCEAGNSEELATVIRRIKSLPDEKRAIISANAQVTAMSLTDKKVANDYIETVLRYKKQSGKNETDGPEYHSMNFMDGVIV